MDAPEAAALRHYEQMIAQRFPPHLAAALAAARYQVALSQGALPVLRDALVTAQEAHPDLKRDTGRTIAAIDRKRTNGRTS
jgi:hypothetical protein